MSGKVQEQEMQEANYFERSEVGFIVEWRKFIEIFAVSGAGFTFPGAW